MDSEDKEYTVVIQDPATGMLLEHARFLAQVSENAAYRLVDEFYNNAKSLEHMPERCPWLSDINIPSKKYRKLILEKRYLILFIIREDTVYIDAVVDCRQDYGWLL